MHAGQIGTKARTAEIVKRRGEAAPGGRRHHRLKRGEYALAIGLAERNESGRRRYPVRRQRVKEGLQRGRKRNRMRGADETDRDRIDDCSLATRDDLFKAVATPCTARDLDEGPPLRRGLELPLARAHEGCCELHDVAQTRVVAELRRAAHLRQDNAVAEPWSIREP